MAKSRQRKKKKIIHVPQPSKPRKKTDSYSSKLTQAFREKQLPKSFFYNYHSKAFQYFHAKANHLIQPSNQYRKVYWSGIGNGTYPTQTAFDHLKGYRIYLENEFKKIIEPYSIGFWMHVSRRIQPNTTGEDNRPETIMICRNIITAAIQKYAKMESCGNLCMSDEINIDQIFNGLFTIPEFEQEKKIIGDMPPQLVLTGFDETTLVQYYELERLAYEMWLSNAKNRIVAKGANLVVNLRSPLILFDDRNAELAWLTDHYDNRTAEMNASATGTVFTLPDVDEKGIILLCTTLAEREGEHFSDPITEKLNINFTKGGFPNFAFHQLDIRTFLAVHEEFAEDFQKKWQVPLYYVIAVLTDIALALTSEILHDKDSTVAGNAMFRAYRLYERKEFRDGLLMNWKTATGYLGINLDQDEQEIDKALDFITLDEANRQQIFIDTFGPLKVILPAEEPEKVMIDHSLISELLYNLFAGLPLKDRGFKGDLLERALKTHPSYLPTTESKGMDGTAKQVDYSVAKGDILLLVECKAVARSFGIFGGQAAALEHRLRNVIHKGLDDVDAKVKWFIDHPKGTNYDLSQFEYIVGITVSPFLEFMPTRDDKYWLSDELPRVLTIDEFEKLVDSDLQQVIKKNLVPLKTTI